MSEQLNNVTREERVSYFSFARNDTDDGGRIDYRVMRYLAADGVMLPETKTFVTGKHIAGSEEAQQLVGAAVPMLGLPVLVDPVTGADLSLVSNAGMVLIVERLCSLLYIQQQAQQQPPAP